MKSRLLKIGIVLIIVLMMCTGVVQAAYTTFGISPTRTEASKNYVYTFRATTGTSLKYIWNVKPYANGTSVTTNKVFYCLAQGHGDFGQFTATATQNQVPEATGGISNSEYVERRLKDNNALASIRTIYSGNSNVKAFDEEVIHGLVWILDNMYIPNEEERTTFLDKIQCTNDLLLGVNLEGYTVAEAMQTTASTEDDLTDSDIEVAQQLAIWRLTNPELFVDEAGTDMGIPKIFLADLSSTDKNKLVDYKSIFTEVAFSQGSNRIIAGTLREYYVKMVYKYLVDGATEAQRTGYNIQEGNKDAVITVYANANAQPIVTVTGREIKGKYNVVIKKVDTKGTVLPGAVFTVNEVDYTTGTDGTVKIASEVEIREDNAENSDTYTIVEKTAPTGYIKYNNPITATVTKKLADNGLSYILNTATLDNTSKSSGKVTINNDTNTVTITVVDPEITGKYDVILKKENQTGEILPGAVFTVNGTDYTTGTDGTVKIASEVAITRDNLTTANVYTITEKTPPEGYMKYNGTITATITKKLADDGLSYTFDNATLDSESIAGGKVTIAKNTDTNTITITVKDEEEKIEEYVDFALRKSITKVVDKDGATVYTEAELENRIPRPKKDNLKGGTPHTAEYRHDKSVLPVSVGNKVIYTIRVYNEGNTAGYITQVTDYLPKYLEYVDDGEWSRVYGGAQDKYASKATTTPETTITGASSNLSTAVGKPIGEGVLIPAYDKVNDKLSYIEIQITCEVQQPKDGDRIIEDYKFTNIAEITGMADKNKTPITTMEEELDSDPGNIEPLLPATEKEWQTYKDNEIGTKEYIPGKQDDDDFEKVEILNPRYDLSLRKFIIQVGNKNTQDEKGNFIREPKVDTTTLKQGIEEKGYGTATYVHPKKALPARKGEIVTYVMRVYNEGNMNAYVDEITDYLPPYLEYLEDEELNQRYQWSYNKKTRKVTTKITAQTTDDKGVYAKRINGKLLSAYNGGDTLDYIEVAIRCRVSDKAVTGEIQTNIAEITKFSNEKGEPIEIDRDSKPNGKLPNEKMYIPSDADLPKYMEEFEENPYVPGQEDDDDYEKVEIIGTFDLALRKFITKVNTQEVNTRKPELSLDDNGNIKYTHTKTPVEVCTGDTVIYTIRVYNEGEFAGYATEITDNVPFGLEFIKDNEINIQYGWSLLDETKQPTEDVSKAKYIVTNYLAENAERDNLIKPFNKNAELSNENPKNPDYRDVQIAFKVVYQAQKKEDTSRTLVNVAQISAASNDNDIDSTPRRDEIYNDQDHEDDIDYENVKVKYFDLALLKWVTRAVVVENGETKIIESGHTGYENPEPDLKVELKTKDIKKSIVKFAYTIKIINEGEIEGYAKEITDYIPEGLAFKQEDNPDWYVREDGVVATAQLSDTLLKPGESAEVEIILTWINGEKNLGRKVNVAEISIDDNSIKIPDIDSTPDNKEPKEDDIDEAPVLLVIKTGTEIVAQYITLTGIVIAILGTGIVGIKKFVL